MQRRQFLRLTGASAAGGMATALAGCSTTETWESGDVDRLTQWLYDPAEYGATVSGGRIEYREPVSFARNRTYLDARATEELARWHLGDPWTVSSALVVGLESPDGVLPELTAIAGSFGVDSVRSRFGADLERVGSHAGRTLYRVGPDGFAALEHGEYVTLRNVDRAGTERYLDRLGEEETTLGGPFSTFFDVAGVGAAVTVTQSLDDEGQDLVGHVYRLDGPKTRARSVAIPGVPPEGRERIQRLLEGAKREHDAVLAAEATFAGGYTVFDVTLRTEAAPFGSNPLGMVGV